MNEYYEGSNEKLFAAISPGRNTSSDPRKGEGWGSTAPGALKLASERLDASFRISLDEDDVETLEEGYDCLVMGDFLEASKATVEVARKADANHDRERFIGWLRPQYGPRLLVRENAAGRHFLQRSEIVGISSPYGSYPAAPCSRCSWIRDGCVPSRCLRGR
jgi:hypothetical protein